MLEVEDLHAYYGKSHILQGISFHIAQGEIISLLGRNGAGRSTTIKTIMGQVPPVGVIRFKGERIDGRPPHEIARRGLGYVPEDREIFPDLTVREYLRLGMKSTVVNFFFFIDTAPTEIYTLSLHDALPIFHHGGGGTSRVTPTAVRQGGAHMLSQGHRSEEHASELQSHVNLVCRLLLE